MDDPLEYIDFYGIEVHHFRRADGNIHARKELQGMKRTRKEGSDVKSINLDREDERVKKFFRALSNNPNGSVLVLGGEPILRIVPITEEPVDEAKLKAAILKRRDESRRLNRDWEAIDREMWEKISENEE